MSEYTTGELARLTNVSIRTIQFYDKKAILKPSHIFENGKRIYTEEDLRINKQFLSIRT